MNNEQNKFYTSISKHYSEIFPYKPVQLQFVKNCVGNLTGKQVLDIGCATGELAFNLAANGANVTGIDLNEDLLKQAIGYSEPGLADSNPLHPKPEFLLGNMLELDKDFQEESFDAVLCFGNTLVHLQSIELIRQMLDGVFATLKPGGKFLIQILNYDYIINGQFTKLPLIETDNIKFIRKYKFEKDNPVILFQTKLHLKEEGKIVSNETPLLALRSDGLVELLKTTGFKKTELFSNFKKDIFGGKHLPLVVMCIK